MSAATVVDIFFTVVSIVSVIILNSNRSILASLLLLLLPLLLLPRFFYCWLLCLSFCWIHDVVVYLFKFFVPPKEFQPTKRTNLPTWLCVVLTFLFLPFVSSPPVCFFVKVPKIEKRTDLVLDSNNFPSLFFVGKQRIRFFVSNRLVVFPGAYWPYLLR